MNGIIPAVLGIITFTGLVFIIGGAWYATYEPLFGWIAMGIGIVMSFYAKHGVHHTVTQPLGLLLVLAGIVLSLIAMVVGESLSTLYQVAIGMVIAGVSLLYGRSGGWHGA